MLDSVEQQAVAWAEQVLVSAEQVLASAEQALGSVATVLMETLVPMVLMAPMASRKTSTLLRSSRLTTGTCASTIPNSRRKGRTS